MSSMKHSFSIMSFMHSMNAKIASVIAMPKQQAWLNSI